MYFRYIITLLLLCLFYASCKKENPYVIYNDSLFQYKTKADSNFISFSHQLDSIILKKEYQKISRLSDAVNDTISQYMRLIEKLPEPENGKKFKTASINYLKALSIVSESYKSYILLSDEQITPNLLDSVSQQLRQAGLSLDEKLGILLSEQKEFAEKNNIKLENTPLQP